MHSLACVAWVLSQPLPCIRLQPAGDGVALMGRTAFLPAMHRCRLLSGEEPLMKVRLTKLADGDILAITLSHVITGQRQTGC